jgi:hypothetical protein
MIYKTLLRKLKIEQHVLQKKRMDSGALERIASGWTRTAYTSGAPEFSPSFQWGTCTSLYHLFIYMLWSPLQFQHKNDGWYIAGDDKLIMIWQIRWEHGNLQNFCMLKYEPYVNETSNCKTSLVGWFVVLNATFNNISVISWPLFDHLTQLTQAEIK